MEIDVGFDVRTDSRGKDPDIASHTLRKYHQFLWSKPLPNGDNLNLLHLPDRYRYLISESKFGPIFLSSDSITTSMAGHSKLASILSEVPEEIIQQLQAAGSTIGARTLFPGKKVRGQQTINQARGFSGQIKDRFDLTLECIRLFYLDMPSPLSEVLGRYRDFFELFGDLEGYVDFFLLQDLMDGSRIRFFLPFESFEKTGPYPKNVQEYMDYMTQSVEFVERRNVRIAEWAAQRNQ